MPDCIENPSAEVSILVHISIHISQHIKFYPTFLLHGLEAILRHCAYYKHHLALDVAKFVRNNVGNVLDNNTAFAFIQHFKADKLAHDIFYCRELLSRVKLDFELIIADFVQGTQDSLNHWFCARNINAGLARLGFRIWINCQSWALFINLELITFLQLVLPDPHAWQRNNKRFLSELDYLSLHEINLISFSVPGTPLSNGLPCSWLPLQPPGHSAAES